MAASLTKTQRSGLFFAFLGIFAFSLSLPFTKLALKSFDPLFTAFARPVIAACLAIPLMFIAKVPKLPRELWRPTAFTAAGAVFGWPILIALALQRTTSAVVSVIAAVMPLVTAIIAVIKHKKHPGLSFWVASTLGTVLLVTFSITRGGTSNSDLLTDLLIIGAVIASSYCYVEGASLTSYMPGWQVISWVVVISLPIALPASVFAPGSIPPSALASSGAIVAISVPTTALYGTLQTQLFAPATIPLATLQSSGVIYASSIIANEGSPLNPLSVGNRNRRARR